MGFSPNRAPQSPTESHKYHRKEDEMELRPYQKECIAAIEKAGKGNWLVQLATGLGKTVIFTSLPRKGRTLILSHRQELVHQPIKYYDCPVGIEQGPEHSHGESVVSASVQSMSRRLTQFSPSAFDRIIVDECHHSAAKTYKNILQYFRPRQVLGFTATPNRADNVRLDDVFSDIIFERGLAWGIKNGYLSDIYCRRANIGYDLTHVAVRGGDYAPGELDEAMDGTAGAIAEVYSKMAKGATLVFAVSVKQAEEIASEIPGAVSVTANTKGRDQIIQSMTDGKTPCITSVGVFTEGTDIPRVETIIIARPTQSDALYTQMVGRGLRLYPGKQRLNLIDCVGVTGNRSLCTAPSLLGIDMEAIPHSKQQDIEGLLFELPEKAAQAADCPQAWVRNVEIVNLWAKKQGYNLHNVNWFKMPDGRLVCCLRDRKRIVIPAPDDLGRTIIGGEMVDMQKAIDRAYKALSSKYANERYLWDLGKAKRWGAKPASEKQKRLVNRLCKGINTSKLTKLQASQILNRRLTK